MGQQLSSFGCCKLGVAAPCCASDAQPTEWRAITLRQLDEILALISERLQHEVWVSTSDWDDKKPLTLEAVTLYDLAHYVLLPLTVPDGIKIAGLPYQQYVEGDLVWQVRPHGRAKGQVQQTVECGTEVTVCVMEGRFESRHEVIIHGRKCTEPRIIVGLHCSYVGLITRGAAQKPAWFVSHWWGEPVRDFIESVRGHAQLRGLSEDTAYWVCAYANDQHDLAGDVSADPKETSFFRALATDGCAGVVVLLNGGAQPAVALKRVWCIFEIYTALTYTAKMLDFATFSDGKVHIITQGLTKSEQSDDAILPGAGWENKTLREQSFPLQVLEAGLSLKVQDASASMPEDKQHILNTIANIPLDQEPPTEHCVYDSVNQTVRGLLAGVAWPQALRRGKVADLNLPDRLRADEQCADLSMSFSAADFNDSDCVMDDEQLRLLAEGLPPKLSGSLVLDFSYCDRIGSKGICALSRSISKYSSLTMLSLNFSNASVDKEEAMQDLGSSIRQLAGLKSLTLQFNASDRITDKTMHELTRGIGSLSQLEELCLIVAFCMGLGDRFLEGLSSSVQKLRGSLASLRVDCTHCRDITNQGIIAISGGLRGLSSLMTVHLSFHGCHKITDAGASALGSMLGQLDNLKDLDLGLELCTGFSRNGIEHIARHLRGRKSIKGIVFSFTAGGVRRCVGSTADLAQDLSPDWWTEQVHDDASTGIECGHGHRLSGRRVLLLTDFNFWDEEYNRPRMSLEAQGAQVCVASKQRPGTMLFGQHGTRCRVDFNIDDMYRAGDYMTFDAVFIPGGAAPQRFRNTQAAHKIIEWMVQRKRVVAAICHGVKALGAAGVLSGAKCTSYSGIKLAVQRYGGEWVDQPVVVHEQCGAAIVTSRTPPDLLDFSTALVAEVEKRDPAAGLATSPRQHGVLRYGLYWGPPLIAWCLDTFATSTAASSLD